MPEAERMHSMPPTNTPISQSNPVDAPSRRRFLSHAAGGAVLAVATIPPTPAAALAGGPADPVFGLIAAHKKIVATAAATAAEIRSATTEKAVALEQGVFAEQNCDEYDLLVELTEAVPTTLAGIIALVTYLDEVNKSDPWKFEDNYATPLIGALAKAFDAIAVAS